MYSRRYLLILTVVGVGLTSLAWADDPKKADPKADKDQQEIKSKGDKADSAATIDFGKALGLSFPTLTTLGVRIEQARTDGDPVGLAAAANELAVAEKVAKKQAPLTADALLKEAAELAGMRAHSKELRAVAMMTADNGTKDKLQKAGEAAEKQEAEVAAAIKAGEKPKGLFKELIVYNESEVHVHVYINGEFVGSVEPYDHSHFRVHVHSDPTYLSASGHGHSWRTHFHGDYDTYTWRLLD